MVEGFPNHRVGQSLDFFRSMAEKFGNFRWVKDGYLDNRSAGLVVGRMTFAVIGTVSFCLRGDFKNDIAVKAFSFRNSQYLDDELAGDRLADLAVPQLGVTGCLSTRTTIRGPSDEASSDQASVTRANTFRLPYSAMTTANTVTPTVAALVKR